MGPKASTRLRTPEDDLSLLDDAPAEKSPDAVDTGDTHCGDEASEEGLRRLPLSAVTCRRLSSFWHGWHAEWVQDLQDGPQARGMQQDAAHGPKPSFLCVRASRAGTHERAAVMQPLRLCTEAPKCRPPQSQLCVASVNSNLSLTSPSRGPHPPPHAVIPKPWASHTLRVSHVPLVTASAMPAVA